MLEQLIAKLGLDASSFLSASKQAEVQLNSFKQSMEKLGLGSVAALGSITAFFKASLDWAQNTDKALTSAQFRAREFANDIDKLKQTSIEFGANMIGGLNGIGEKLGEYSKIMLTFITQGSDAAKAQSDAFAEEARRIAEIAAAERDRAEFKRVYGEQLKQTNAEILKQEKELAEIAFDKLTPAEKLAQLEERRVKLASELINLENSSELTDEQKVRRRTVIRDLQKATLDIEKERKAVNSELEKMTANMLSDMLDQVSAEASVAEYARERLANEQRVSDEKERQVAAIEAARKAEQDKEEAARRANAGSVTYRRGRENYELSDAELAEKVKNLADALAAAKNRGAVIMSTSELDEARAEQQLRQGFRLKYRPDNPELALMQYSAFDRERLLSYVDSDEYKNHNKSLEENIRDINRRLANVFPK